MLKLFVTGGAGFIGSNFILWAKRHLNAQIINFDKLTYAGNLLNLAEISIFDPNYGFLKGDICDRKAVFEAIEFHKPDWIVNFAADSHVDRSIEDSAPFLHTNVLGTAVLLDACKRFGTKMLQISTDEVHGSIEYPWEADEKTNFKPGNPYSASKAAAELLVQSYMNTHGVKAVVTRCSNNYGPFQFPEKLIPLFIQRLMKGQDVPMYGDGQQIRDWIHVWDHCSAIGTVLQKGIFGQTYCISTGLGHTNYMVAQKLCDLLHQPYSKIVSVKDRPGHDRRYALNPSKIQLELGWKPVYNLEDGLSQTVDWYIGNQKWLETVTSGEYKDYYARMYGGIASNQPV